MRLKYLIRNILLLLLIISNVSCDQISKQIARNKLTDHQEVNIIPNHFILTKVENSGAFLSLGTHFPMMIRFTFLTILPCLVLIFGLYYLIKNQHLSWPSATGIAFAVGGGIGNLYDRIRYGSVTDFMYFHYSFIKTGVFNMADVSVMVGRFLILLSRKSYPSIPYEIKK
ncbi:signal peptidase II [Olivibacter ginsenosidimutans]|uniref:Lipoprotein signal peptidase n=1 Tax=Olivibacter ginsenosidimutans TaxID=1176537 RepID=A0ABP9AH53_9SPHI